MHLRSKAVRGLLASAVVIGGLVAATPAGAVTTISVSPSTGLVDGQAVTVTISGGTGSPSWLGECGNAYADGTPLPAGGPITGVDCSGPFGPGPAVIYPGPTNTMNVRQQGVGTGNRSCVQVAPRPCTIWGVGQPVPISFASDAPATPVPTSTEASVPSLPVPAGQPFGIRVHVALNGPYYADGTVEVRNGSTVLGTGTLTQATTVVTVPGQSAGTHQFEVAYLGNGSFQPSSTTVNETFGSADSIAINDVAMYESTGAKGTASFTVALSRPSTGPVQVHYAVTPDTAIVGRDYTLVHGGTGTLSFGAGKVALNVNVPIVFDETITTSRTFHVTLSAPTAGYELARATGTGTLLQPHDYVSAAVASMSITEGNAGPNHVVKIPIVFTAPPTRSDNLTVTITRLTASNGGKTQAGDFAGSLSRQISYKAGTVTKVLTIAVYPDTSPEGDETFQIKVGGSVAVITILGDE